MQLGYVIHYVENVDETLGFYERAFGCTRKFLHEVGDYGELDTGATTLAFAGIAMLQDAGKSPARADPKAPVSEIAFVTDDVAAAFAKAVENGAGAMQEPTRMPWGQTVSFVSDMNGFLVEICSPVGQ
ncbi:MAG: VOC family protein [Paracoccaceae bacterium]